MSAAQDAALAEVAAAARELAAALRAVAEDPADQVRMLREIAQVALPGPAGSGSFGQAAAAGRDLTTALCRRAAITEMARAVADYAPRDAEECEALRDAVSALIEAEEVAAADAGEDAVLGAFRALRLAVAEDLTIRGAALARLRTVETPAPVPALALAQRLYGDGARGDNLADYARAIHPLFLPTSFRAPTT